MIAARTANDLLRERYFALLPGAERVLQTYQARLQALLVDVVEALEPYEIVRVTGRVKGCESAIAKVRRQREVIDDENWVPDHDAIDRLRDLVGVRVMVFPGALHERVSDRIAESLPDWDPDHRTRFNKYRRPLQHGVGVECQVVPLLLGLFWEVEHDAVYKPHPSLRNALIRPQIADAVDKVEDALLAFQRQFESAIAESRGLET